MRKLTKRFLTSVLDKYESKTGNSVDELIGSMTGLSVSKILDLIQLGNNNIEREDASRILDDYLADEDNTLITALFDLLDEFDRDTKMFKSCGVRIEDLKKQMLEEIKVKANTLANVENNEEQ